MEYTISQHALTQMEIRNIPIEMVEMILSGPDQKFEQDDLMVFQSIIKFQQEQEYLVRVFVNSNKIPPLVVTVYRTSKIEKYYEGKI